MKVLSFLREKTSVKSVLVFLSIAGILIGCAETQLGVHTLKTITNMDEPVSGGGTYKVGTPYEIKGVWYYPKEQPKYDETGIASWYGKQFHGKRTANGEVYNMNALTAAHKTLPMPIKVRVTNLENGRSLLLTVNDRGPFVAGRIIDVSRRGAQLLGFLKQGTAKVRVQFVAGPGESFISAKPETPEDERRLASAAPVTSVSSAPLDFGDGTAVAPPPTAPVPQPVVLASVPEPVVQIVPVTSNPQIYIQAGAFGNPDNARRMMTRLISIGGIGNVNTTVLSVDGKMFHRVRIGPISSIEEADQTLRQVLAMKVGGARIVVD